MKLRARIAIGLVTATSAAIGALALYSAGDSNGLPAGATILQEEDDGVIRVVTFRADDDSVDAWLDAEGMRLIPEQMTWRVEQVDEAGAVYAAGSTPSTGCAILVHRVPEGALELYRGCGELGLAAIAEVRANLSLPLDEAPAEDSLPLLWTQASDGVTQCEQSSSELGRTIHDFDEQGRLVRERRWRVPPDAPDGEAPWEWSVMRWRYVPDGSYVREETDRPDVGPWERDTWRQPMPLVATPRSDGAWLHHEWTRPPSPSEERSYRLEDGRLLATAGAMAAGECTFDPDGRPLSHTDELARTEWQYTDGVLSAVVYTSEGLPPHTTPVERGTPALVVEGEDDLVISDVHYRGDCTEVVFYACSAVMNGLGHPLPRLLPRPSNTAPAP